jgi:hypothetical protein
LLFHELKQLAPWMAGAQFGKNGKNDRAENGISGVLFGVYSFFYYFCTVIFKPIKRKRK